MGAKEPKFEKVRRFVMDKPYTFSLYSVLFIVVALIVFFMPAGWIFLFIILVIAGFAFVVNKVIDESLK